MSKFLTSRTFWTSVIGVVTAVAGLVGQFDPNFAKLLLGAAAILGNLGSLFAHPNLSQGKE